MKSSYNDFEHDPRYEISRREMWICVGYWAMFTAVSMTLAWTLGNHSDGSGQVFIMGFPAWLFWSGIAFIAFASMVVPYFMVRFLFTEMSLEPEDDGLVGESHRESSFGP